MEARMKINMDNGSNDNPLNFPLASEVMIDA